MSVSLSSAVFKGAEFVAKKISAKKNSSVRKGNREYNA